MKKEILYFSSVMILIAVTIIFARSFRTSKLPHGGVNSCATCHVSAGGGGALNAFGQEVDGRVTENGQQDFWTPALALLDSDGDGYTNGQELQDTDGTWQPGDPAPGDPALVSNPGDATSTPLATSVDFPYTTLYEYKLFNNYPNPFNPSTKISFSIAIPGRVNISIYSITGELVKVLVDEFMLDGVHEIVLNLEADSGFSVNSGVYFYRLTTGRYTETKRMVFIK